MFTTENSMYGQQRDDMFDLDSVGSGIDQFISRYTQKPAVVLDYDGVLTAPGANTAFDLIHRYHTDGFIDEAAWDEFQSVVAERAERRDREFEGELLSIATQALEGEKKGELRSTTADFVAEHRDDVLATEADQLIGEQQAQGREVYIVSNNYRLLFEALADNSNINLNNVYSNVLAVSDENGNTLNGQLSQRVYDGKQDIAEEIGDDRYIWAAAGDSMSDY
ncbi:MAG: haloacid dehalogenase-like hydrolase, partial [Candidatus Nanohaloarchaea archaeon]|nr:haloacid dehalogenase-like hydrolase [Candidatus Nanohaloarchaea archaeon]